MKQPASYYKSKAKDSFRTKLNLFLYDHVARSRGEFTLEAFREFIIKPDLVQEYTTVYWQSEYDDPIRGLTIRAIYDQMKSTENKHAAEISSWETDYVSNFEDKFPFERFKRLIENETCHYCGITKGDIENLAASRQIFKKNERGWTMEIDRRDSNLEYTADNCVMACYWCNNAKTDEFTAEEFKIIAQGIRQVWDQRRFGAKMGGVDGMEITSQGDHGR